MPHRLSPRADLLQTARAVVGDESATPLERRFARELLEAEERVRAAWQHGIRTERKRIIDCVEDVTGRRISDGGQYRADIRSSLNAWKKDNQPKNGEST